jgi:hypothetical protein
VKEQRQRYFYEVKCYDSITLVVWLVFFVFYIILPFYHVIADEMDVQAIAYENEFTPTQKVYLFFFTF